MRMETSDEILVAQAQTGDADAFGALVARHYDLIFRLAFRMLGSKSEAQDLAQDVCVGLASKINGFRGESKFTTWLYRVAINAAKDRIRKHSRQREAQEDWGEVETLRQSEQTEAKAERQWLEQALATLSDDLRETVTLVLGEELTHADAAETLNVSEGTVSWRMSEVKKLLRALAQKEERYP